MSLEHPQALTHPGHRQADLAGHLGQGHAIEQVHDRDRLGALLFTAEQLGQGATRRRTGLRVLCCRDAHEQITVLDLGPPLRRPDLVETHVRGDAPQVRAALREAIDSGWRVNWWMFRLPAYDGVRDHEEYGADWNALVAELEADIAKQREWYYANKDQPLF